MTEHFEKKKTKKGILLMLISSICACIGQLLWKLSVEYGFGFMLFGFCLYGAGALIMIIAYRFGKLSELQPILSLNYVFSIVLGALILKEQITVFKLIGVVIIVFGVIIITRGDEK